MVQNTDTQSLAEQLDARKAASNSRRAPADRAIMDNATQSLADSGIIADIPGIGSTAPDFTLLNVDGTPVSLSAALQDGPVVLVFYRGGWCPYCNIALRAYQAMLPEIIARGATLITVSPQTPDNSLTTAEKNELEFAVLSDADGEVARAYGLVFSLLADLVELYRGTLGIDLEQSNGNDRWELPVPGTFVIDTNGTIQYAFAEADYTKRAEPSDLITALDAL